MQPSEAQPQPQRVHDATLPPGYAAYVDPTTNLTFYRNESTGRSQWEHPATAPSPSSSSSGVRPTQGSDLPSGWLGQVDPKTSKTYYVNTLTGKSQWARPQQSANDIDLPQGFTSRVDPASGKTFYVDLATGKSQWNKPVKKPTFTNLFGGGKS